MYTDAAIGRSEEGKESKYSPELITTQAGKSHCPIHDGKGPMCSSGDQVFGWSP